MGKATATITKLTGKVADKVVGPDKLSGGAVVSRILAAEGVDRVFGIIDGTYFGLYSSFAPNGIELISPRHETAAAHMAGAYARLTGKVGVCMASNGPGVANILPGVAVENAEGNRVLLLTSCRRTGISYPDRGGTFQCFPQVEVTAPMTKWSVAVPSVDRIGEVMRRAFRILHEGRPGVVHVDIPESILNTSVEENPGMRWFQPPERYRAVAPLAPSTDQVRAAADLLVAAEAPMIHAGSGVVHSGQDACDALVEVASLLGAPVTTSWGGRTVVDERHELSIPVKHLDAVQKVRTTADAALIIGSRLGETDWWGKPPYWRAPEEQKAVQVDTDPEILGTNKPVDVAVQADAGAFLAALVDELKARKLNGSATAAKRKFAKAFKSRDAHNAKLAKVLHDRALPMHTAHVPVAVREVFGDDAVLVIDGGNTAIWCTFQWEHRRTGGVLSTFKMGMLGAGVPQAVGAKVARPDSPVVCILGDGAFGMQLQEVETAVREGLPVIWLVVCDKQWGMVKMNQQFTLKPLKTLVMKSLGPDETIKTDFCETRYDDLARAMGAHGERVADPAGLEGALRRSVDSGKPAVIHVDVDNVKHMWAPALREFKAMHAEPAG